MARRKQTAELIRGHAAHRRTEADCMGVLLEAATLIWPAYSEAWPCPP